MKDRTVVVTGANGFVGGAVCAALRQTGALVRPICRSRSGDDPDQIPVGLIGPDTDWSTLLSDVDSIVHCAARVHQMIDKSLDPLQAFREVNTFGTLNLAHQAARSGIRRFVFVSSIKVSGDATVAGRPFHADGVAIPDGHYGQSKMEAEIGLRKIAAATGMECVIVRPPLVYGPGVRANFAQMMRWIAKGVPLPLGAVTGNRRSLVGRDNLVDLLLRCLAHPGAANQTFLASDNEDLSTTSLLRRLGVAIGRPARLVSVPANLLALGLKLAGKQGIASRLLGNLQVDISKTKDLLDWHPPISVDEGLRRCQ